VVEAQFKIISIGAPSTSWRTRNPIISFYTISGEERRRTLVKVQTRKRWATFWCFRICGQWGSYRGGVPSPYGGCLCLARAGIRGALAWRLPTTSAPLSAFRITLLLTVTFTV